MNLTSEKTIIFVEKKKIGEKAFKVFSTSIGKKDDKGKYSNMKLEVSFVKELNEKYQKLDIEHGYAFSIMKSFLSFRAYEKDGTTRKVPVLIIQECKPIEKIELKKQDNKLPF